MGIVRIAWADQADGYTAGQNTFKYTEQVTRLSHSVCVWGGGEKLGWFLKKNNKNLFEVNSNFVHYFLPSLSMVKDSLHYLSMHYILPHKTTI